MVHDTNNDMNKLEDEEEDNDENDIIDKDHPNNENDIILKKIMKAGVYTGEFLDGLRHGQGTLIFENGDTYIGSFLNGYRDGFGKMQTCNGNHIYEGEWKRSKKNGKGKEIWKKSNEIYEGYYINNKFHGKGILKRKTSKYEGSFQYGLKSGEGTIYLYHKNNKTKSLINMKYTGNWLDNKMSGYGVFTKEEIIHLKDKKDTIITIYEGTWKNSLRHGKNGIEKTNKSNEIYEGEWVEGQKHGKATIINIDTGKKRNSLYENNKRIKWIS